MSVQSSLYNWERHLVQLYLKYIKYVQRRVIQKSFREYLSVSGSDVKPSAVEQTGLMRMWMGRGSFCFNCLKSLANSLSLECGMTSTLTLLHSLGCSLSLCAPSDDPAARGKILRPDDSVETDPIITGAMSESQSSRFLHHIFVWLACLMFISVSHTLDGPVCVCLDVCMDYYAGMNGYFSLL